MRNEVIPSLIKHGKYGIILNFFIFYIRPSSVLDPSRIRPGYNLFQYRVLKTAGMNIAKN